jgi:S-adenosylmethionine:tRNA ribosyltransferase-isomerase
MKASDFDYTLPEELIAQAPLEERTASRLLVIDPSSNSIQDEHFSSLGEYLKPGDLLVFNDTRVFPARLFGRKATGGQVEILVERILDPLTALAHLRSSKSPRAGSRLLLEDVIECEMTGRSDDLFVLKLLNAEDWLDSLEQYGHMPLPPYIQRADSVQDRERYQTVYARETGAVAAPTAGLHFNQALLEQLEQQGIDSARVTLHVGAGTFQPLRVDDVSQHLMHAERVRVDAGVCDKINQTREHGGSIIAVGTTVVRSLEAAARGGRLQAFDDDTRLFIKPGFDFHVVDAMLTNFHLPRSTLLMLVSAFAGREFILKAYRHAVESRYRFFSYGDAMFIRCRLRSD